MASGGGCWIARPLLAGRVRPACKPFGDRWATGYNNKAVFEEQMDEPTRVIIEYQRALFERLEEFFVRATATTAVEFSTIDGFSETVRMEAQKLAKRGLDAYPWAEGELRQLYSRQGVAAFRAAKQLGGLKLVQGGSSRFESAHFESARGSLLYADTVLIADPVAPWLERERQEERFRHVLFLQSVHALLHLKPLVDADLPYPAIIVFPSWEKLLEDNDPQTQQGIVRLLTDVLARFVDSGIESFDDAAELFRRYPERFVEAVEHNKLIVAPDGLIGESVPQAIARYETRIGTWRSSEAVKQFRSLAVYGKLLQILIERITPQYHILENSEELSAHPLLCIEQQMHYFKIVSQTNRGRLEKLGLLNNRTQALINGLSSERLKWLHDVPMDAIVDLRTRNENIAFRKRLDAAITKLHESTVDDIDKVAAEICMEINQAIADHNQLINEIDSKYAQKHIKTAGAVLATAASALVPSLAPYIGAALPFAIATKFAWDAWDKRVEKQRQGKSLMGVLAATKSSAQ